MIFISFVDYMDNNLRRLLLITENASKSVV